MSLADGPFGSLSSCAVWSPRICGSGIAANQTSCLVSNTTCLCLDSTFFTQATDCTTLDCGVKAGLSATNLTMSICDVPQASQALVSPVLAGVLGMLALIMVSLRLVQRTFFNRLFGLDDGLIVAALICAAPLNCTMFPMQKFGLGTNIWTIPFEHITKELELLYVAEVCYMAAEALTQLSFLAFYLRIFPIPRFQLICYCLMGLSICFGISNTFVMIFQCTPVPYFWSGWTGESEGTCIDINGYSWYKAAVQIAMDLGIITLPIWPLLHTAMSTKKKVQIILMFCTGFLITVVSCLRLRSLVVFSKSSNTTYANTPAVYWSVVECDVAIICACMPALPSLLKHIFPSIFGQPSSYYYDNKPPQYNQHSEGSVPLGRIQRITSWQVSTSETQLVHEPVEEPVAVKPIQPA